MGQRSPIARAVLMCLLVCACGGSPESPPPGDSETITGSERFGWDQPASDAGELALFRYAIYVDDRRTDAIDVTCASTATNGRFACSSRLPVLASGSHTLQVAAFVVDGTDTRESSRSAAVRIVKQ